MLYIGITLVKLSFIFLSSGENFWELKVDFIYAFYLSFYICEISSCELTLIFFTLLSCNEYRCSCIELFCKVFFKRIPKTYQTIIDTGINQTNREFRTLIQD